jgi:dihydroxyacetone kinase-like protein
LPEILNTVVAIAITGMEATRDMITTKGRASFLEQRSLGHIDAGAKTAQLMISAIVGDIDCGITSFSVVQSNQSF